MVKRMIDNNVPILYNLPLEWKYVDIYFIGDLHYGSNEFDCGKWSRFKKSIANDEFAKVIFIGDLMENAIPNSKSDIFSQTASPHLQKEWVASQLAELKDKVICVVSGNHEFNRSTKNCDMYPLYDACVYAGVQDKYRDIFAICDIGIGDVKNKGKQYHYVGQIQHRAKDIKSCCSADFTDGIDFFAYGHDHEPKDKPRAKLVYDPYNKVMRKRNVEVLNSGAFLQYGGYGARTGYRVQSDKIYMLRIYGNERKMTTTGFYV